MEISLDIYTIRIKASKYQQQTSVSGSGCTHIWTHLIRNVLRYLLRYWGKNCNKGHHFTLRIHFKLKNYIYFIFSFDNFQMSNRNDMDVWLVYENKHLKEIEMFWLLQRLVTNTIILDLWILGSWIIIEQWILYLHFISLKKINKSYLTGVFSFSLNVKP